MKKLIVIAFLMSTAWGYDACLNAKDNAYEAFKIFRTHHEIKSPKVVICIKYDTYKYYYADYIVKCNQEKSNAALALFARFDEICNDEGE